MLLKRKVVNRWQVLNGRQDSRGLDHFSIPCETPVIPAKAGIQSVHSTFPKVRGVDSRFRGNDCGLERPCPANDTTAQACLSLVPELSTIRTQVCAGVLQVVRKGGSSK